MEDRLNELPKGWVWTKMEKISEINPKFNREGFPDDIEVTFLPMRCVEELTGHIDISLSKKMSEVIKGYTSFVEGDLLFAKITPCMENGKTAIAHGLKNGIGFGSTEFHIIRPYELLPRKFLFFFLIQEGLRRDAQRNMTGSAGQLRVPVNYMNQIPFPLPPLPEQHRIVTKIEELFTKLDAGTEALKKIKAQLKRYRQAVLKYAFEGKLTQAWREAHKGELEPASVLLERIKEQRQKDAKGKFKELPPIDTSELPELPDGWAWTRVGETSEIIMGQSPPSSTYNEDGIGLPFYQGKLEFGAFYPTPRKWCPSPQKIAEKGDVLISVRAPVGPTNICPEKSCIGRGLASIRALGGIKTFFLLYLMRAFEHEIAIQGTGTTFNAITVEQLKNIEIPLPPLPEQTKIVAEIESRFSIADNMEKVAEQSLKQSDRLRQSILKRAFEGKLVPQDPTDEPADKLLERIKEEKVKREAENKKEKKHRVKTQNRPDSPSLGIGRRS